MPGYILLEGGGEFGGQMAEPDRKAIQLAGGFDASVRIIPAAAAPDQNDRRAGQNGVRWFQHLGARQVQSLPLIDRSSADDPAIVDELRRARLIYLLGGFPDYLGQTLSGSESWRAVVQAYQAGAVIAGSSAGAMVLCQHYYDPEGKRVRTGLNLLSRTCVIPHYNTFGSGWAAGLAALLPGDVLIGIDEQTGMISDGAGGQWNIYGKGVVTILQDGQTRTGRPGELISTSSL